MFTDNDELSGLIASMMDLEALIILSNMMASTTVIRKSSKPGHYGNHRQQTEFVRIYTDKKIFFRKGEC